METALEHILRTGKKADMLAFIETTPGAFEEAVEVAIEDRQPFSWRSALIVKNCMDENDERVRPYIESFVNILELRQEGHQREILKILFQMELPDEYISFLYDFCVRTWKETKHQPSLRHTAIGFVFRCAKENPDLFYELSELGDDMYMNSLSPGVKYSVRKWFKESFERD